LHAPVPTHESHCGGPAAAAARGGGGHSHAMLQAASAETKS
jgi:hypothetical protein